MRILKTPAERFDGLPDYPFEPRYVTVDGLDMHYVDEGEGPTVLLLHGEPTWSYLYRHMIPLLVDGGCRAVAPDLVGFGRSDKPSSIGDYSYARQVAWTTRFVEALDLSNITLFCQDWGSLIGLRIAAEREKRFARIALANGGLPTGDTPMPKAFLHWQRFARFSPYFPIGRIVQKGTVAELPDDVVRAYDAPFPGSAYKAGARAFPQLVPTTPDDPASDANRAAWQVFERWEKPFLTLFSNRDPITRGGERTWQQRVPGARNQPHRTIDGAGHFLQEERPQELADAVLEFVGR